MAIGAGFVSYEVKNDKRLQDAIDRSLKAVDDLTRPFQLIVKDFYRSEQVIFRLKDAGMYPDFSGPKIGTLRHEPLKQATAKRQPIPKSFDGYTKYQYYKEKKTGLKKGYPLLKFTGALEKSVTQEGAPGSIARIEKDSLEIGTSIEYGVYHQQDDGPGSGRIPMRKFLFIGPESAKWASNKELTGRAERWLNILNTFVLRELGTSFEQSIGE